jgi:hypothetical protein
MKAEIEFEQDFDGNHILPIPLGRLYLGDYCVRLFFSPTGKMVMFVPGEAVRDGLLIIGKILPEVVGLDLFPEGAGKNEPEDKAG